MSCRQKQNNKISELYKIYNAITNILILKNETHLSTVTLLIEPCNSDA